MIQKSSPLRENVAEIILNAVIAHERQVGISTLALILKGSRAKQVTKRHLYTSRFFGALFYHNVDVIENFIKQLVVQGAVRITNMNIGPFFTPVVELSENGKKIIRDTINIELIIKHNPLILMPTMKETLNLFQQYQNVTTVAEKRNLAESTIWGHILDCIKLKLLTPADVVEPSKLSLVLATKNSLKTTGLKELKEALPENITYGEMMCALQKV